MATTRRTINRHLADLETRGLIEKDDKNYYFPYDVNGNYQLIDYEMLNYLWTTGNKHIIHVYTYLHMKNSYIKNYQFTKKELLVSALGFSEEYTSSQALQMIDYILECLSSQCILKYSTTYTTKIVDGWEVSVPVMTLERLITKYAEKPKADGTAFGLI